METTCTLAIIGDGSVGKSSLIAAFRNDGFTKTYKQTVGCDFYEKPFILGERNISLRVWDIGGQSMNSKNLPQYLSSSQVVFIVYDVTNPESFANVDDWLRLVCEYSPQSRVHLVGNKVDLLANRRVSKDEHDNYVIRNPKFDSSFFMSARTGENVVKAFYKCAAESVGIKLSAQELAYYDVVLKAHITNNQNDEARTDFADQIEEEDRLAEERKRKKEKGTCICS
mmetsp:Transcript_22914/g.23564  ORF Transcript_22914/g.23564 Transcript_22914/m.23564 type:complete len:226 (+) Transcript_22914:31-708(+)